MQQFGFAVRMEDRGADVVEQAVSDVLLADVISQETKARLVNGLTALKAGLDCPDRGCSGCFHRRNCERLVEGILSTT
ncbi:hypothetical protein [Azospirillum rugosum]|uniref:Uncharacterized protein n=1 Tax=Azospirillum rugosum TaxID=416170 RepID=A0ABS4SEA4_9PROT|nr:hypothetical protein [Azospirillum rugosum]MBP2290904.1 hypothetical protein [Azospirillum rugosum]MDQ0525032.1 hypothetical protein [Azospirillum rugosum]